MHFTAVRHTAVGEETGAGMLGLEAVPRPRGLSRPKLCGLGLGGLGLGLGLESHKSRVMGGKGNVLSETKNVEEVNEWCNISGSGIINM